MSELPYTAATSRPAPREPAQGTCTTADGLELHWRRWDSPSPQGALLVVHGLAEHGGRYAETAGYFAAHGWTVLAGDLRGHGLSADLPGAGRVHVDRFDQYFDDVDALRGVLGEAAPQLPLFLLGHSMGGLVALRYALEKPAGIAGAVISSPALGSHPQFSPPVLLRLLMRILDRLAPRLRFASGLDTDAISRDPRVVRAYREDPLVSERVSARWYGEVMRSMTAAHARAQRLSVPVLLMQSGADRLVDPAAPARWAASAPAGRVELVHWAGLYHEMFNEPEKLQVQNRTLDWLRRQQHQEIPQADPATPAIDMPQE